MSLYCLPYDMADERSEPDARSLSRSTASRGARQVALFRHACRAPQPLVFWRRWRAGKCELRRPAGGVTRAPRPLSPAWRRVPATRSLPRHRLRPHTRSLPKRSPRCVWPRGRWRTRERCRELRRSPALRKMWGWFAIALPSVIVVVTLLVRVRHTRRRAGGLCAPLALESVSAELAPSGRRSTCPPRP